jgi:hypothetical protein
LDDSGTTIDDGLAVSVGLQTGQLAPLHADGPDDPVTVTVACAELPSGSVPLMDSVPAADGVYTPEEVPIEPVLPDATLHVAVC